MKILLAIHELYNVDGRAEKLTETVRQSDRKTDRQTDR
jgi:hypothetical protein